MFLLRLIRQEVQSSVGQLLVMAALAGISNALLIAVINSGAEAAASGRVNLLSAITFILCLLIYIKAQHYILATTTTEVEAAIHRLRLRLMDDVRHAELLPLEAIGRSEIIAAITKETATLTQAATIVIVAAQASVLIFFTAMYVAYLSVPAFLMSAVIMTTAATLYLSRSRKFKEDLRESLEWENRLFDRLADLLEGFKEVRLHRARSRDLFEDITAVSSTAAHLKIKSQTDGLKQFIFSQSSFFVLLGAIVFVIPSFSQTLGTSMVKTTTALLFIIGAISSVVQSIPMLAAANAAAENIVGLEASLRGVVTTTDHEEDDAEPIRPFRTIEMRDVSFQYVDKQSEAVFRIGPINFKLNAGEIVFVSGGNGSGKSTFLKTLIGLYPPDVGTIKVDGEVITSANRDSYRERFTAVFSDYHLFKKLYGIHDADPAEVERLLALFELTGKTRLVDGEFTTLELSAGQRKRLALIVGLLENRQILILDEWTADQDPEFRRKYYDELLPSLQREGKTVIAVTHDDRHLSDFKIPARMLRMEDGRLGEQDRGETLR